MVKPEINDKNSFLDNLKKKSSGDDNNISKFISYILDFKKSLKVTAIMSLIIFIISLKSGGYYFVFKSIVDMISTRLPSNANPHIIFFIIKLLVFITLFKLILKTLFDLIFLNREDEELYCRVKEEIDFIVDKISIFFFGFYMYFLLPTYILNNLSTIYSTIIDYLKPSFTKFGWSYDELNALNSSKSSMNEIQITLNREIYKFL